MKCFIVISDGHTGHKQGLVSPDSKLEEDVPIPLYPIPKVLWEITETVREWVNTNCKKYDKWLINMGETTQGNEYTDDLLTSEMHLQFKWAGETMHPFLDLKGMKGARFLQATGWHEYGDGSSSKLMTEMLKMKYSKLDIKQMNQSRMMVDNVLFEWTHHGSSTSKRKYLEGNAAFLDAKDRIIHHLIENKRCPDLTFTSHTHKPSMSKASVLSEGKYIENTQVITPPMCGPGSYSRKVANPSIYYVGCHVVLTDGHGFEVIPFFTRLFDYTMEEI